MVWNRGVLLSPLPCLCGHGHAIVLAAGRFRRLGRGLRLQGVLIRANQIVNLMYGNSHVSFPGSIGYTCRSIVPESEDSAPFHRRSPCIRCRVVAASSRRERKPA